MSVHASVPQEQQDPNMAVGDFKQQLYSQLKAAGVMSSLKVCKDELAVCRNGNCSVSHAVHHNVPAADSAAVPGAVKASEATVQYSCSNTN